MFPFFEDGRSCYTFNEVLERYVELTPLLSLSGPTNFAPIIKKAISIVKDTKDYHILLIIADGQVDKVKETQDAIVEASRYPLSIVMIGVGDGPWDQMQDFVRRSSSSFWGENLPEFITSCHLPPLLSS